jgi:rubredoxin
MARLGREKAASIRAVTRWKCRKCSFIYDPRLGDPDGGIPPGTPFEQIPDSWRCPVCGVTKRDFYCLGAPQPATHPTAAPSPRATAPTATTAPTAPATAPPRDPGWTVGSLKQQH